MGENEGLARMGGRRVRASGEHGESMGWGRLRETGEQGESMEQRTGGERDD